MEESAAAAAAAATTLFHKKQEKKLLHSLRPKKKTQHEKRARQSGRNTDKPYISSSLGDMARLMMRMACTEDTLNMTDPPPVEFYDFWHTFSASTEAPSSFIDPRRVSIPRLTMNTSSYELMGKATRYSETKEDRPPPGGSGGASAGVSNDPTRQLAPRLSALWRGVRISMSGESFISSSTKVSERHEGVGLEAGWSDEDQDVSKYFSDSEDELGSNTSVATASDAAVPVAPTPTQQQRAHQSKTTGSTTILASSAQSFHDIEEDHNKEMDQIGASITRMELEEVKAEMEQANAILLEKGAEGGGSKGAAARVVDYFMGDLDDSFLIDAVSYGLLPDSLFTQDFDYFNEDAQDMEALFHGGEGGPPDTFSESATTLTVSDTESEEESNRDPTSTVSLPLGDKKEKDYATCLAVQKRRIEERIKAAALCRSAMGSYIPPSGKRAYATSYIASPGPGAYYPSLKAVLPTAPGVPLGKRWNKSIYEIPGPGPGSYYPDGGRQCGCGFKYTRAARASSRFGKEEGSSGGPGPGQYTVEKGRGIGDDKPHALILSRRPPEAVGCGGGRYQNIYGMTRYGRKRTPRAILIGKRTIAGRGVDKDVDVDKKESPSPHCTPLKIPNSCGIGIKLKSRISPIRESTQGNITGGFYGLPQLFGSGPGITMGSRKFKEARVDSPGPIYLLPEADRKPVSLTFKPFPMRGKGDEPSPMEYGGLVGDQWIKTKRRGPVPVMVGSHEGRQLGDPCIPGPKYKVPDCRCKLGATLTGRYTKKIEVGPGPAYNIGTSHLPSPPRAVFQSKWKDPKRKDVSAAAEVIVDGSSHAPQSLYSHGKVVGGLMSGRWPSGRSDERSPGFQTLFGYTSKGNYSKIPISFKSRQSPFVYARTEELSQKCTTHASPI